MESRTVPSALTRPRIALLGEIGEDMTRSLHEQLAAAGEGEGDIALELTTTGSDAGIADEGSIPDAVPSPPGAVR